MKLVVNKRYGGFGLSVEAQLEIHKHKGCKHQKVVKISEYFKGNSWRGIYKSKEEYIENHLRMCEQTRINKDSILTDDHRDYENRDCPVLIEVVEKLGDEANGRFAELEVMEIPDGIDWEIDDYDGIETIHEEHRSW